MKNSCCESAIILDLIILKKEKGKKNGKTALDGVSNLSVHRVSACMRLDSFSAQQTFSFPKRSLE